MTAGKHRDLEKSQITKSKTAVQGTITVIKNFANPFQVIEKDHLFNLASGAPSPKDVKTDVLPAEEVGKENRKLLYKIVLRNGRLKSCFSS